MVSLDERRAPARMCTGIPATQAAQVRRCEDCTVFQQGDCRGRDPKVPLQVSCGVALLGLIFVGATMFF